VIQTRLFGMLLAALSVQFVVDGLSAWFRAGPGLTFPCPGPHISWKTWPKDI